MADYNFLPFFLTEPVYLVREHVGQEAISENESEEYNSVELKKEQNAAVGEPPKKIIQPEEIQPEEIQPEIKKFAIKSRGGFKKNVLLLVDDPYPEVLNITDTEFLQKILKAVKLSEEDVIIVNINHLHEDFFPVIKEYYDFRFLIMFGVKSASIEKEYQKYKISNEGTAKVLYVDSLPEIDSDKQKKLKLWENLQLLFIMK